MSSDLKDPAAILSDLFRGDPRQILSGVGDAIGAVQSDSSRVRFEGCVKYKLNSGGGKWSVPPFMARDTRCQRGRTLGAEKGECTPCS